MMMGHARWALLAVVAAVVVACGMRPPGSGQRDLPSVASSVTTAQALEVSGPTPCEIAAGLRERAPKHADRGFIDRALRAIRRADELCPSTARASRRLLLEVLVELGENAEATKVADALQATEMSPDEITAVGRAREHIARESLRTPPDDATKEVMRKRYAEGTRAFEAKRWLEAETIFKEVWRVMHPQGETLYAAAMASIEDGRLPVGPDARRLFDRALHELENARKKPVHLEVPNGFGDVAAVSWSRDGKLLAILHERGMSVVDVNRARESFRFEEKAGAGSSVAFAPDGKKVLASIGPSVKVWETQAGAPISRLVHDAPVLALGFSKTDGILTVTTDGTLRSWGDGARGDAAKKTFETNVKDARTAAFSPDGRFMAIASQEGAVQIIDASTGKRTREIAAQKAAVRAVSFDESAHMLACAHADGSVRLYALPSGALKKKLTESEPSSFGLYALSLSPDGSTVAAGTYWGRIVRWDVASGKERPYVSGHGAMVSSVAFSPDGRTLASGSHDATVAWWDASTGAGIVTLRTHTATARAAFSPTADLLAVTGDQMTRIWRFDAETSLDSVSHPCCTVDLLDFAPDGARIALGARTHAGAYTTLVAEAKDAKMIWSTDPERSAITALAFSEKAKEVFVAYADRKVRGFSLESGERHLLIDAHDDAITSIARATPLTFATGSHDRSIRFWSTTTGERTGQLDVGAPIMSLALLGTDIITATSAKLQRWDIANAAVLHEAPLAATTIALGRDRKVLYAGAEDGTVRAWDLEAWKELRTAERHPRAVTSVSVSADGEIVASASRDGVVLERAKDGKVLVLLRTLYLKQAGYALNPDASAIEIFGQDGRDARSLPICRIGSATFPFELCAGRVETEGLVSAIMSGAGLDTIL